MLNRTTVPVRRLAPGEGLFSKHCGRCHGPDGRLGLDGAHDLTRSTLSASRRAELVERGQGRMPAFKNKLSPQVIELLAAYSMTLK